jgi:hypothetical protein
MRGMAEGNWGWGWGREREEEWEEVARRVDTGHWTELAAGGGEERKLGGAD